MSSEARPPRRWLQFSRRSMFILALVVASFCAGVTYQREVRQRLRAELKQAKAETENANRRATFERLRREMARIEAERRLLQTQIKTRPPRNPAGGRDQRSRRPIGGWPGPLMLMRKTRSWSFAIMKRIR